MNSTFVPFIFEKKSDAISKIPPPEKKRNTVEQLFEDMKAAASTQINMLEKIAADELSVKSALSRPPLQTLENRLDSDTTHRIQRSSRKMSEFAHSLANEPSIGLYHVSHHVRKSVPKFVEIKKSLKKSTSGVEALNYDLDYTILTVKNMGSMNAMADLRSLLQYTTAFADSLIRGTPLPSGSGSLKALSPPPIPSSQGQKVPVASSLSGQLPLPTSATLSSSVTSDPSSAPSFASAAPSESAMSSLASTFSSSDSSTFFSPPSGKDDDLDFKSF